jgi:hypothetical protein
MTAVSGTELVREVVETAREIVARRIGELEAGLAELEEALESAAPQNPMEDDGHREQLAEERLHLQSSLSRKEALLRHLKRMPVACCAARVRAESVVVTDDGNVLLIVPEADGESFHCRGFKVSLMSTRAPLYDRIKDLHPGDTITWKNGKTTAITAVC